MATRPYWFAFGAGKPSTNTGLSPTFIFFVNTSGATIAPPSITETYVGTGLYLSNYSPTQTIAFVLDGATTGLISGDRYITGVMDPYDMFGGTLTTIGNSLAVMGGSLSVIGTSLSAMGVSIVAMGISTLAAGQSSALFSFLGSTASSIGTTSTDPGTVFGFLMRSQEIAEGNKTYTKSSGTLDFLTRGSTLIREKTITDSSTSTTTT